MKYYDVQLPLIEINDKNKSEYIGDVFQQLQKAGFRYHATQARQIDDETPDDELIDVYRDIIEQSMEEDAYSQLEVIRLQNYSNSTGAYVYKPVRDEYETRLITHGRCSLFVQLNEQVFEFQCSQGDMVRIPGDMCYWFEVGMYACRYIHLYMTGDAWDRPSERQDIQPCSTLRQAVWQNLKTVTISV